MKAKKNVQAEKIQFNLKLIKKKRKKNTTI